MQLYTAFRSIPGPVDKGELLRDSTISATWACLEHLSFKWRYPISWIDNVSSNMKNCSHKFFWNAPMQAGINSFHWMTVSGSTLVSNLLSPISCSRIPKPIHIDAFLFPCERLGSVPAREWTWAQSGQTLERPWKKIFPNRLVAQWVCVLHGNILSLGISIAEQRKHHAR